MILIGQFDSPFVRRVGIALRLYGMGFEHRPWSTFGEAEKIAAFNPLRRVPTLVLDDGEVLIDSFCILDALDQMVGEGVALIAATGPDRRRSLKICALAAGAADKGVSLLYERHIHERQTPLWLARCRTQIEGALDALEAERSSGRTDWWFGANISHADIMVATMLFFINNSQPGFLKMTRWPALAAHSARCEALAPFIEIQQAYKLVAPSAGGDGKVSP